MPQSVVLLKTVLLDLHVIDYLEIVRVVCIVPCQVHIVVHIGYVLPTEFNVLIHVGLCPFVHLLSFVDLRSIK